MLHAAQLHHCSWRAAYAELLRNRKSILVHCQRVSDLRRVHGRQDVADALKRRCALWSREAARLFVHNLGLMEKVERCSVLVPLEVHHAEAPEQSRALRCFERALLLTDLEGLLVALELSIEVRHVAVHAAHVLQERGVLCGGIGAERLVDLRRSSKHFEPPLQSAETSKHHALDSEEVCPLLCFERGLGLEYLAAPLQKLQRGLMFAHLLEHLPDSDARSRGGHAIVRASFSSDSELLAQIPLRVGSEPRVEVAHDFEVEPAVAGAFLDERQDAVSIALHVRVGLLDPNLVQSLPNLLQSTSLEEILPEELALTGRHQHL
mmetsp:Transcript_93776/g.264851  ORF Transcript_93776/g.264851 Transcript_93776/m.264851 type:complete len:321 (+) Transcript_93776:1179-2141(+)